MDDQAKIAKAREALDEPYFPGTQVTNCLPHSQLDLDKRPDDCRLCAADIRNNLMRAIRVNEFLNRKVEAAAAALKG